jgi:hypothetical protein
MHENTREQTYVKHKHGEVKDMQGHTQMQASERRHKNRERNKWKETIMRMIILRQSRDKP